MGEKVKAVFASKMFHYLLLSILGFSTVYFCLVLIGRSVTLKRGRGIISNRRIGEVGLLVVEPTSKSKLNFNPKELKITKNGKTVVSLELDENKHLSRAIVFNGERKIAELNRNVELGRWGSITFISEDGTLLTDEKFNGSLDINLK